MLQPSLKETVRRKAKPDDEFFRGRRGWGKEITLDLNIVVHPCTTAEAIVINYPGYNGDIDGYKNKYRKIAEFIRSKGIAGVIQMSNSHRAWFEYSNSVVADLKAVIEQALKNSSRICGSGNPKIYLMGYSAGASAVAAVSADYPQIKKILLMAPSGDAGDDAIAAGLAKFTGEVYITVGENDEVVGKEAGQFFAKLVKKAAIKELRIIPNCDHQFRGTTNGKIMSKAPLWAFAGDSTFPSPDGGIVLY